MVKMTRQELRDLMPEDFPWKKFNAIGHRLELAMHEKPLHPCIDYFPDSWIAVAYRFITSAEHDIQFRLSMQNPDQHSPQYNHYIQESELFGFFVSGLVSIECTYFSCYLLAATLNEKNFPVSDHRLITIDNTIRKYKEHYTSDNLSLVMERILIETEYKNWKDIRNLQAHRMLTSQQFQVTLFPSQPAGTLPKISWIAGSNSLDINSTASYRAWLATKLTEIIEAIDEFTLKYF
jgi:hypothetical protein